MKPSRELAHQEFAELASSTTIAGDICYNELHQWLMEATSAEKRGGWIAGLEEIVALKPGTVIASHKRPGAVDGINNVYSTIAYIRAFGESKAKANSAEELFKAMIAKYPNRINPIILCLGCEGNFPGGVKVDGWRGGIGERVTRVLATLLGVQLSR